MQKNAIATQAGQQQFLTERMLSMVDSQQVPEANRLDYWKNHVHSANGLKIECATNNFVGVMTNRTLSNCSVHGVKIQTPHRAIRESTTQDLCFVNVQVRNEGARFNGNREFSMQQGSLILYEACEAYELDFDGASESLVIAIAKSDLEKRVANIQMHLDEAITYDPLKTTMLAGLLRGVLSINGETRQAVKDGLSEAVLNMLVATLYDCDEAVLKTPTNGSAAILQRIKSFINTHLDNPDLNPVMTAEAMGITVSYLHKIFLQNNTTLMQFVLAERLERCRRDIAKGDRADGISQIAYRWGFNDASHFSRSFRKRFGTSPRDYRADVFARDLSKLAANH
ncbi:Transcriptional activator FeaR [Aquimixticola soesokkakensis]|uniref:Transcriptional activator FeaR n=1 Tax=Aquimixticola soesokkakensis TaxID=1519096 RepID=A0A1Y5S014_9RHOB|nr:helix-turn-helix domain-containing protein [Aquimixticola soesokkakensis]SLN28107.1 Transcriptional activator FeaR [Aquimixticola soesokkakensis]